MSFNWAKARCFWGLCSCLNVESCRNFYILLYAPRQIFSLCPDMQIDMCNLVSVQLLSSSSIGWKLLSGFVFSSKVWWFGRYVTNKQNKKITWFYQLCLSTCCNARGNAFLVCVLFFIEELPSFLQRDHLFLVFVKGVFCNKCTEKNINDLTNFV